MLHDKKIASIIKRLIGGKIPEAKFSLELWTENDGKIDASLLLTKRTGRICATLMLEDGTSVSRTFQLSETSVLYALWVPLHEWLGHKLKAYNWFSLKLQNTLTSISPY